MAEKKYIELEAVKAVLNERYKIRTHMHDLNSAAQLKIAELEIGDIPAADVRPVVRGKWIPWMRIPEDYICDKCEWHSRIKTNFCPNCGADMMEGET